MTEVMAADGTESLIWVTSGTEVAVGAEVAEAGTTGTVELEDEPEEGAEPLVELPPVEGPEEPEEAPSQRAGPGIS